MQTPEGVLTLVLAGLHDGENQCSDTDGSELVAMTSVECFWLLVLFDSTQQGYGDASFILFSCSQKINLEIRKSLTGVRMDEQTDGVLEFKT